MKQTEFTGKTVDQAIENGLEELEISRDRAEIEIISAGGGLFAKAKVRITVKDTPGEKAQAFLAELLKNMGVEAEVELDDEGEESVLEIKGEETNRLFARRGEVIDALQYLSSLVANVGEEGYRRIVLDSEHYRDVRRQRLEKIADDMAAKAIDRGYRIKLEPMNPFERRIIHTRLAERAAEITTHSEGEEPNRFVVIVPVVTKAKSYEPKEEATSDYSSRPRRDGKYHPERYNQPRSGGNGGNRDHRDNRDNRGGSDRRSPDRDRSANRPDARNNENRGENASERGNRAPDRNRTPDRNRGGYGRNDRYGDRDRAPKPPRAKPAFLGTILTTPIKPTEPEDPSDKNE